VVKILAIQAKYLNLSSYYTKKKDNNSYLYWKAEWRGHSGQMKQAHLGPAKGKKGLSEDEALVKARKMKAEDPGAAFKP
jgi:hypothetical protein